MPFSVISEERGVGRGGGGGGGGGRKDGGWIYNITWCIPILSVALICQYLAVNPVYAYSGSLKKRTYNVFDLDVIIGGPEGLQYLP